MIMLHNRAWEGAEPEELCAAELRLRAASGQELEEARTREDTEERSAARLQLNSLNKSVNKKFEELVKKAIVIKRRQLWEDLRGEADQ